MLFQSIMPFLFVIDPPYLCCVPYIAWYQAGRLNGLFSSFSAYTDLTLTAEFLPCLQHSFQDSFLLLLLKGSQQQTSESHPPPRIICKKIYATQMIVLYDP